MFSVLTSISELLQENARNIFVGNYLGRVGRALMIPSNAGICEFLADSTFCETIDGNPFIKEKIV